MTELSSRVFADSATTADCVYLRLTDDKLLIHVDSEDEWLPLTLSAVTNLRKKLALHEGTMKQRALRERES